MSREPVALCFSGLHLPGKAHGNMILLSIWTRVNAHHLVSSNHPQISQTNNITHYQTSDISIRISSLTHTSHRRRRPRLRPSTPTPRPQGNFLPRLLDRLQLQTRLRDPRPPLPLDIPVLAIRRSTTAPPKHPLLQARRNRWNENLPRLRTR